MTAAQTTSATAIAWYDALGFSDQYAVRDHAFKVEQKKELRRLSMAAGDLQGAVDDVNDAIGQITNDAGDVDIAAEQKPPPKLEAVARDWHDLEHPDPLRWCQHPVCRELRGAE